MTCRTTLHVGFCVLALPMDKMWYYGVIVHVITEADAHQTAEIDKRGHGAETTEAGRYRKIRKGRRGKSY